jgi:hypothetical protein
LASIARRPYSSKRSSRYDNDQRKASWSLTSINAPVSASVNQVDTRALTGHSDGRTNRRSATAHGIILSSTTPRSSR